MKVKIKGLVFVGFAAAVFAQSAMATISANTADKKIVTSKYYVDSNFQEKEDKVKIGNGTGEFASVSAITETQWSNSNLYPSMPVLKGLVDSIDVNVGVSSNATDYLDVTDNQNGTFTLNLDNAPATAAADLTGYDASSAALGAALTSPADKKLVTAGAINGMILRESTNGVTSIDENATHATVPTSKNVYDYVEGKVGNAAYQRKLTQADTGTLYVGQYDDSVVTGDKSTWKQLSIADADNTGGTAALANTNYVAKTVSGGVYTVNLDAAQIADSIATDNSAKLVTENAVYDLVAREGTGAVTTINGTSPSDSLVPTVKNVYDFVDGNYQPKTSGTNVMVGYNGTWRSLAGDSYITVAADGSSSSVTLTNMTGSTSDFVAPVASNDANYDTVSATRAKLAKSGDVYDFVMAQTGGLAIPEMPDGCDTVAATGGYCALVYGLISGTAGQSGATYGLQWTVMAPDTMPTGTGD